MTRREGTYNLHQSAMFVPNMWEEDDASIDEPAKVEAERGKEDHVVQEPQATAADFYITFLSVAQREKNNKFDATAHKAEDSKKKCHKHVFAVIGVPRQPLFQLRKTEISSKYLKGGSG